MPNKEKSLSAKAVGLENFDCQKWVLDIACLLFQLQNSRSRRVARITGFPDCTRDCDSRRELRYPKLLVPRDLEERNFHAWWGCAHDLWCKLRGPSTVFWLLWWHWYRIWVADVVPRSLGNQCIGSIWWLVAVREKIGRWLGFADTCWSLGCIQLRQVLIWTCVGHRSVCW